LYANSELRRFTEKWENRANDDRFREEGQMTNPTDERLFKTPEMCHRIGTNRQGLAELMKQADFPKPLRFSPNNPKSRLRFRASEVLAWISRQQMLTTAAKETAVRLSHGAAK
jgi:predicted DNA-binding transcriptional regulator AlpA